VIKNPGNLYVIAILTDKEMFKKFANKVFILGLSLVLVIPLSTHLTEYLCSDYLAYVDETIQETEDGADKINEIMSSEDEETTIFDKLSNAFKTAIQGVTDLLTYFKNVIKKCVNAVGIMLVTTFALPLLILILFRWLLKELFSLEVPVLEEKVKLSTREGIHGMKKWKERLTGDK
jgi:predicted PurR-regulated permease PerM